eukprot:6617767-Prymnesium_polylepis.1
MYEVATGAEPVATTSSVAWPSAAHTSAGRVKDATRSAMRSLSAGPSQFHTSRLACEAIRSSAMSTPVAVSRACSFVCCSRMMGTAPEAEEDIVAQAIRLVGGPGDISSATSMIVISCTAGCVPWRRV